MDQITEGRFITKDGILALYSEQLDVLTAFRYDNGRWLPMTDIPMWCAEWATEGYDKEKADAAINELVTAIPGNHRTIARVILNEWIKNQVTLTDTKAQERLEGSRLSRGSARKLWNAILDSPYRKEVDGGWVFKP